MYCFKAKSSSFLSFSIYSVGSQMLQELNFKSSELDLVQFKQAPKGGTSCFQKRASWRQNSALRHIAFEDDFASTGKLVITCFVEATPQWDRVSLFTPHLYITPSSVSLSLVAPPLCISSLACLLLRLALSLSLHVHVSSILIICLSLSLSLSFSYLFLLIFISWVLPSLSTVFRFRPSSLSLFIEAVLP